MTDSCPFPTSGPELLRLGQRQDCEAVALNSGQQQQGRVGSGARGTQRGPEEVGDHQGSGDAPMKELGLSSLSRLPALNDSVIDWPRILFSPRAASARGRLISMFPGAAPWWRGSACFWQPRQTENLPLV